jgi:hypothetical protein
MDKTNTVFLNQFKSYLGKRFEIVTGRNAYTFDKHKHATMLAEDGIYLLLVNPPQDNLKYRYNSGLFIPAKVADKFFPTNDPEKVKQKFTLPVDKIRFEFYQQMHKLYEQPACIIKTLLFEDTRRSFRVDRAEYEYLKKNEGEFIFIYTIGNNPGYIVQVETVKAANIVGFLNNDKKSATLQFEMNALTIKMLKDLELFQLLPKAQQPFKDPGLPAAQPLLPELASGALEIVDSYLKVGMPIKIILPEGKHELVLECTITKQERILK